MRKVCNRAVLWIPAMLLLSLLFAASAAANVDMDVLSLAPMNPEFVEYQQGRFSAAGVKGPEGQALGYQPSPLDLSHVVAPTSGKYGVFPFAFPATYDLRPLLAMTAVRNQNPYGTCWAFGALASLESTMRKSGKGTLDFSEWHLAYFAYVDQNAALPGFTQAVPPPFGGDQIFDQGGNPWKSAAILSRWTGAVNESARPYQNVSPWPASSRPQASDPVFKHLEHVHHLGSAFNMNTTKQALMSQGAVAIRIVWNSAAYRSSTGAYYNRAGTGGGHIVTIAGWNDNYPASNFNVNPGANGAWLVKNSWGTGWGNAGYFWLSYRDPTIGQPTVFLGADKTNFDRIYQYDPLGWTQSAGYGSNTGWFANIFNAIGHSGGEQLRAVSFYAGQANSRYRIEIRKGVAANSPRSGTLARAIEGTLAAAGYHTVRLPAGIPVGAGERFSVVVRLTTPGYNFPIPIERPLAGNSTKARASAGQSFASSNGTAWGDVTATWANTNVCLKAFSTIPSVVPTGSVRVTINGPSAARWRLFVEHAGAAAPIYYTSGQTVSGVPAGSVVVLFTNVSGWNTPAGRIFNVNPGATSAITVTYTRASASSENTPLPILPVEDDESETLDVPDM
jgi:C1A family cysteine protease